jgi:AraC-like DNA-binding protein
MEFISIKEAIEVFGKSDSYFRRLQREWSKSNPKKVKLIEGKVHFELNTLNKKFDKVSVSQRTNFDKVKSENITLTILERELEEKNKLIQNLSETIKAQTLTIHNLTESVKTIEAGATKKRRWFW